MTFGTPRADSARRTNLVELRRELRRERPGVEAVAFLFDTLAQHVEDNAFKTPINMVVVDHDGEAARVVIRPGEISYQ